jgi:hypothetical protein
MTVASVSIATALCNYYPVISQGMAISTVNLTNCLQIPVAAAVIA